VCDGIDNDCDGVADEGACAPIDPGVCDLPSLAGRCERVPATEPRAIDSGCRLPMPPGDTVPCAIPEAGPVYYVRNGGDDAASGTSPAEAWATLCHATATAPAGSTIRVAEGSYDDYAVGVDRALVVKGGFDATFADWNPDAHPTWFAGHVRLAHDEAVFGGFRLTGLAAHEGFGSAYHDVYAGTLVRNTIDLVDPVGDHWFFYGINGSTCAGHVSTIACNDVRVTSNRGGGEIAALDALAFGNTRLHYGLSRVLSNRICVDVPDGRSFIGSVIGGYGTCGGTEPSSIFFSNNVLEMNNSRGALTDFYGCGGPDLSLTWTNNTMFSRGSGLAGYAGDPSVLHWRLINNIIFSDGSRESAVSVGSAPSVEIVDSQGNLTFGFATNTISPAPLHSAGDDTTGAATAAGTFRDSAHGDYRPLAGGPATGTGVNVFGLPETGGVVLDLAQTPRPAAGPWDRGAFQLAP
jgi:hypothetical protein